MPPGHHVSKEVRELLYTQLIVLDKMPQEVISLVAASYTLKSLANLKRQLQNFDEEKLAVYMNGPKPMTLTGRKRTFPGAVGDEFVQLRLEHNQAKLSELRTFYDINYVANSANLVAPSTATISRILARAGIVRKIASKIHALSDPLEQHAFLEMIAPVDPLQLVDVDETKVNNDEMTNKYAWAPVGQPAQRVQLRIDSISYSVVAAYCPLGFINWTIFEDNVGSAEIVHYVENNLNGLLSEEQLVLLDNAKVHKTDEALAAFEAASNGAFAFVPPYSPQLKPIELGFASIKKYLRSHEHEAQVHPLEWIERAFRAFAVGGEHAESGNSACYHALTLSNLM